MAVTDGLSARDLRWIADSYDQAQRVRLQAGERIRAVVQGRDGRTGLPISDAREQLKRILQGKTDGPVPLLGRTYRRHWEAERELRTAMEEALRAHVVWPWLSALRGIGVTLAARLLARLDIHRAPTPSSFWAYCGLATVPAQLYRCAACGVMSASASGRAVRVRHRTPDGEACAGQFAEVEAHGSVRVAQPGPRRGEVAAYDRQAKKLCYLIGVSFLRSRSVYRTVYDRERTRLEQERIVWPKGRQHLAALRKMEKVFLSHLWAKWAEAAGIPDVRPYVEVRGFTRKIIPPEP